MRPERVVVVGTSVGGVRTGQALRAAGYEGDVVVVGAEDVDPYDKPPLSKQLLTGDQTPADVPLLGAGGWSGEGLIPVLGRPAVGLDRARREVVLADGERIGYDALVIATGARPRTLTTGREPLVRTVRELRDATGLREQLLAGGPVVVVGSGFIGGEVASSARQLGVETTMLEALPEPFARVLGTQVAERIRRLHADAGVQTLGGAVVERIEELSDGSGVVHLADGRRFPAAVVVVGIGVVPNTEWLEGTGLDVERGILTDQFCRAVGARDVYAVGDVARSFEVRSGGYRLVEHWTNAVEQAGVVAHNIVHPDDPKWHDKAPYFWSDQHGIKIQMIGRISPGDDVTVLRYSTTSGDKDVALYSRDGSFTAAVVLGWPRASVACRQAWERGADLAQLQERLAALTAGAPPVPVG